MTTSIKAKLKGVPTDAMSGMGLEQQGECFVPKSGATNYHAQLGLPGNVRAINKTIVTV